MKEENSWSTFWLANTITAAILGEKNRSLQEQIAKEDQEFQQIQEKMNDDTLEISEQEKMAFRKKMAELTRQWQRKERLLSIKNANQTGQLKLFASSFPLNVPLSVVLQNVENREVATHEIDVFLLHTPLISGTKGQMDCREGYVTTKERELYEKLEYHIKQDAECIKNVRYHKDSHSSNHTSSADIMNMHYIMGSIPTIVIIPKYMGGKISISVAMWDAQSSRPLIKPIVSIAHDPFCALKDEKYSNDAIEKLRYIVTILIAVMRDQFAMLTWGEEPMLNTLLDPESALKKFMESDTAIQSVIFGEYCNTISALDSKENTSLLFLYREEDLKEMKEKVIELLKSLI